MKLAEYLSVHAISPSAFAAKIGSPASTITRLLRGERAPSIRLAQRIREATGGAVTSDDFLPDPTSAEEAAA